MPRALIMYPEQAKSGNFVQKLNSMSAGKKKRLNKFEDGETKFFKKKPYFLHSIVTYSTNLKRKKNGPIFFIKL
jgi:hypothetical protein